MRTIRRAIRKIELHNLRNQKLWGSLLKMTVPGWCAKEVFNQIREGTSSDKAVMYLLTLNKMPVAWAAVFTSGWHEGELWAFTKPQERRKGHQKLLMRKVKQIHGDKLDAQRWDIRQIKAFNYYRQENVEPSVFV